MEALPASKLEPTKITGMYPLLGAILAVTETLLGVWFFKAGGGVERSIAGTLMTVILVVFLLVVVRWNIKKEKESGTTQLPGIPGPINLPATQATAEQIKSPEPESYVPPNRSYLINRPPDSWETTELSFTEWMTQQQGITDLSIAEKLWGKVTDSKDIVTFRTRTITSIIPIPGTTTIDGRKFPTALETPAATHLTILPLNRAQPPLFVERPLIHNFTLTVAQLLAVTTLHKQTATTIPNTQRQQLIAEFSQAIDNAIVNGQEGKSLTINGVLIGIEGDIQDYVLIMQYPSLRDAADPELSQDQQTLKSLVSSFRPIKIPNPEARRKEIKAKADQEFEKLMETGGEAIFIEEFKTCLFKLSDKDLSDLNNSLRAIKMLKPFKVFAEHIKLKDADLDKLWASIQKAEEGNIVEFKENLENLIEIVRKGGEDGDESDSNPLIEEGDETDDEEEGKPN